MNNLEKFSLLVVELKQLYVEKKKLNVRKTPLIDINRVVDELNIAKDNALKVRKKEVYKLLKENPLKISAFELMEYKFHENSHSNILQYLFDYNLFNDKIIKKDGADILCEFIDKIDILENKEDLKNQIQKRKYEIKREEVIDGGRIDIFIIDRTNQMVIVIENKINASVSEIENENGDQFSQLIKYENYIIEKFSSFKKSFILLSYADVEDDHKPFINVNYNLLINVLENFISEDNILNEYKILLNSLVNNIHDKKFIIRQIHQLDNLDDIYLLQQIKKIYGN